MFFTKIKTHDINDLKKVNKNNVIDVRTKQEHRQNAITGSKNIELNTLLSNYETLLKQDQTYYMYCQSGMRSKKAVKFLTKKGYDVYNCGSILNYRR